MTGPARLIMIQTPFFCAPAGQVFGLIQGTYEKQVCDICGREKKCDYYYTETDDGYHVYMDVCRGCQKTVGFKEDGE